MSMVLLKFSNIYFKISDGRLFGAAHQPFYKPYSAVLPEYWGWVEIIL